MSQKSRQMRAERAERNRVLSELNEIRGSLGAAYRSFNNTTDPDLLDASIYEINALRARYDHALRRAKTRLA